MKNKLPIIVIITDTTYYPIFFQQKMSSSFHITTFAASTYTLEDFSGLQPDIIIIDEKEFKGKIGNICSSIRNKEGLHDVPILVITGVLKKSYIDQLIKAGANDFIREPLEEDEVLTRIEHVQQYRTLHNKVGAVATQISQANSESDILKHRFLLNRLALNPIYEILKKGGHIGVIIIATDHAHRLDQNLDREIGGVIKKRLTEQGVLFSLGNGKFIIFVKGGTAKQTFLVAESLRSAVSLAKFEQYNRRAKITISLGVSTQKKPPYTSIQDMIRDARNALAKGQEVGNSVIVHYEKGHHE